MSKPAIVSEYNMLPMSRKEGSALSDVRKRDALNEVLMHNDWFLRHLLVDDQSIIVVPRYKVDYRDEYLP